MASGLDIMALPFIHEAIRIATKVQGCADADASGSSRGIKLKYIVVLYAVFGGNVLLTTRLQTHICCCLQMVMEMVIVYPNKMDFPVMEDFGVPPPPLGMLEVNVRHPST
jgi:hypothetical protein